MLNNSSYDHEQLLSLKITLNMTGKIHNGLKIEKIMTGYINLYPFMNVI